MTHGRDVRRRRQDQQQDPASLGAAGADRDRRQGAADRLGPQPDRGNLIWYNDFTAAPSNNGGGGKGGATGGGKGAGSGSYDYSAAVIIAVCEGPVVGFTGTLWANEIAGTLSTYNLTAFLGTTTQTAWGYFGTTPAANTVDVWSDTRSGVEGPG